jgi:organic hydroperoxide reductase OsmC/OhrA
MHPFPHCYDATATVTPDGPIPVSSAGLPTLTTAAPVEFDGPGGYWSPETLLVAAVADCYTLTFRGIARASKLTFFRCDCTVTGRLERVDGVTQFTRIDIRARVEIPAGASVDQATRVATKAESTCLITRSLKAAVRLDLEVVALSPALASSTRPLLTARRAFLP